MDDQKKYTFFWEKDSPFSQWHPSEFEDALMNIPTRYNMSGFKFINTEQYMMFRKADMFHDRETAEKILKSKHPREMKALGRAVKNFNSKDWDAAKYSMVKKGNFLKFSQNPHMLKCLKDTAGTILVEASPYDEIWGIGLSKEDPRAVDSSKWKGQNLLGQILTELRDEFLEL